MIAWGGCCLLFVPVVTVSGLLFFGRSLPAILVFGLIALAVIVWSSNLLGKAYSQLLKPPRRYLPVWITSFTVGIIYTAALTVVLDHLFTIIKPLSKN
jgi:hypothetical protein